MPLWINMKLLAIIFFLGNLNLKQSKNKDINIHIPMGKKQRSMSKKNLKDDEKKIQGQMNQMFNIVEGPLMNFIAEFVGESPTKIFHDNIPKFHEPLILMPLEDYKKDICLKFTIKNITNDDDNTRVEKITSLLKHEKVREGIGFIFYSIKNVYAAILSKALIDNKPMLKIKMQLDEENWVFYPKYSDDLNHKKDYLEASLGQNMELSKDKTQSKEKLAALEKTFHGLVSDIMLVNKQITPAYLQNEADVNESFKDKVKIGIFIEELHISELPTPGKNNDLTSLNNMPKINSTSYEEVD